MKISLPLTPDLMVQYFKNKDVVYEVDLDASLKTLTEQSMLMYLSNLGISCNVDKITDALLLHYMTVREFVNIPVLTETLANVLYFAKYGDVAYEEALAVYSLDNIKTFIENNKDVVVDQLMFLDSMFLFISSRNEDNFNKEDIGTTDESTNDSIGFNLVSLITYADFMIIFSQELPDVEDQIYYSRYFDDYMFGGKNLFQLTATSSYFGLVALITLSTKDEGIRDQMFTLYDTLTNTAANAST